MNAATHGMEVNASAPVLYMALELSNKTWRLALSEGAKRRQVVVPAADLMKLSEASSTTHVARQALIALGNVLEEQLQPLDT
jgi:hypothetical protein